MFLKDQQIDVTKIDTSSDRVLQDESHSIMDKIYHEGQSNLEDDSKLEILKKAWNAEGSPFAGTKFDPSVLG